MAFSRIFFGRASTLPFVSRGSVRCTANSLNCDGEFSSPVLKTPVPGPKSKALLADMEKVRACGEVMFFVDYERSCGNYVVDADGNIMMDLFQQIASLPLGYNNSAIKHSLKQPGALSSMVNRPALSMFPSLDYLDRMKNSLLSVAPPGLGKVTTMSCGTCSNENAFKAAFIKFMNKKRGGPADLTSPEYKDAVNNKNRKTC